MFYTRHKKEYLVEDVAAGINISWNFLYLNHKKTKLLSYPFTYGAFVFHIILLKPEEYWEVKKDLKGNRYDFFTKWWKKRLILLSLDHNKTTWYKLQDEDFKIYLHPRRKKEQYQNFLIQELKKIQQRGLQDFFHIAYENQEDIIKFAFLQEFRLFYLSNAIIRKKAQISPVFIEKSINLTKKYVNTYRDKAEIDLFEYIKQEKKNQRNKQKEKEYANFIQQAILKSERYKRLKSVEIDAKIKEELKVVLQEGFIEYFYNYYIICKFLKSKNILYHLKGSGVGSFLLYILWINTINPLHYDIPFSRFIGNGKIADIDIDVPSNMRKSILTALNTIFKKQGKQCFYIINKSSQNFSKLVVHPTGILIEKEEDLLIPVSYNKELEFPITDWYDSSSEPILEQTGYLKYDIISSVVLEEIQSTGISIDILDNWENIHWNPLFNQELARADSNYFQLNAEPIKRIIQNYQVQSYKDLVKLIAINRPAVLRIHTEVHIIQQLNIRTFIHRDKTIEAIVWSSNTWNILIFQDQAVSLLQYILPELWFKDIMNLVKGRSQDTQKYQKEFIERYITITQSKQEAYYYWKQIQNFKKYGLNKAHSHAYGLITYLQLYTQIKKK